MVYLLAITILMDSNQSKIKNYNKIQDYRLLNFMAALYYYIHYIDCLYVMLQVLIHLMYLNLLQLI